MLEQIKRISKQTGEAETPTRFLFGTVTKLSPLTVFVDSRFYLSGPGLVMLKELSGHRHTVPQHATVPVGDHTHILPQAVTQEANTHTHNIPQSETNGAGGHTHEIAKWDTEIAEGLTVGDKVVLLRNQGGQQYLILGRV